MDLALATYHETLGRFGAMFADYEPAQVKPPRASIASSERDRPT